jgi:hypothetical protein
MRRTQTGHKRGHGSLGSTASSSPWLASLRSSGSGRVFRLAIDVTKSRAHGYCALPMAKVALRAKAFSTADDYEDSNGATVLDYWQAQNVPNRFAQNSDGSGFVKLSPSDERLRSI